MNMRKTLTIIACAAAVAVFGQSTPAIGFQPGLQFQVNESVDSLEIIAGSGHLPCIDQPRVLAGLIRGFAKEVGLV